MSNFGAQNQYQGYGQQPPGMGGYNQPQYGNPPGMHGGGYMGSPTGATPEPARRGGTSKALPIMVAAGLAVGVCGGLVLVLGTGSSDAATEKESATEDTDTTTETPDEKTEGTATTGDTTGDTTTANAGTEGTEAGTTKVEEPEKPKITKVTIEFEVDPKNATVTVDGDEISDNSFSLDLEEGKTKTVKLEASAKGYKDWDEEYEIAKNDTVKIELDKKSSGGSSGSSKPRKPRKPRGSGTLIDL